MRILYVTDIHGNIAYYENILKIARSESVEMVINGGDMLPKSGDFFHEQRAFIVNFLKNHFAAYEAARIDFLCMLGNDDLAIFDDLFSETCSLYSRIHDIAQDTTTINGYQFIGMNRVNDYPFRLKDRCRMDTLDFEFPVQLGPGLLSDKSGNFNKIPDWKQYARSLTTIEDEMELLPIPADYRKTIYVIHMPPASLGLDVCADKREVGSRAIHAFLKARQPHLTLHGHIHESPDVSGIWKASIGSTVCIQPGQNRGLAYVLIDLDTMIIERSVV